jgi:hypothetical protein
MGLRHIRSFFSKLDHHDNNILLLNYTQKKIKTASSYFFKFPVSCVECNNILMKNDNVVY